MFISVNPPKTPTVQKDIENLQINLVINRDDADLMLLENQLKDQLGDEFIFKINIMDYIPRSKNGKFRFVISELNQSLKK